MNVEFVRDFLEYFLLACLSLVVGWFVYRVVDSLLVEPIREFFYRYTTAGPAARDFLSWAVVFGVASGVALLVI